jgi:hypothetical protein
MASLFKGWTAGEVLDVLCCVFQEQHSMVLIETTWLKLVDLYDMADIYYDPANQVKIQFIGGPPTKPGMWSGSLRELLMDRFMVAYYSDDKKKVNAVLQKAQNERVPILSK